MPVYPRKYMYIFACVSYTHTDIHRDGVWTRARTRAHTHTRTRIYVFKYTYILNILRNPLTNHSSLGRTPHREIHQKWKHPRLQHRPLVFYCVDDPKLLTNSVMMLSAYLLLAHDFTPEEALLPFARIAGMPVEEYRDATWYGTTTPPPPPPPHNRNTDNDLGLGLALYAQHLRG
jgi:hypothetical protein